jgi:hypothetical protein
MQLRGGQRKEQRTRGKQRARRQRKTKETRKACTYALHIALRMPLPLPSLFLLVVRIALLS